MEAFERSVTVKKLRRLSFLVLLAGGLSGCYHFGPDADCASMPSYDPFAGGVALQCQEYKQREADAALRSETAQLVKAYRLCLAKYEGDPAKAKEYCSVYTQALHEFEIKGLNQK